MRTLLSAVSGTLGGLDQAELTQLANIDSVVISAGNWAQVSNLDQDVGSGASPSFKGLVMSGTIAMNSNGITGLTAPSLGSDVATKQYVDDNSEGITPHGLRACSRLLAMVWRRVVF